MYDTEYTEDKIRPLIVKLVKTCSSIMLKKVRLTQPPHLESLIFGSAPLILDISSLKISMTTHMGAAFGEGLLKGLLALNKRFTRDRSQTNDTNDSKYDDHVTGKKVFLEITAKSNTPNGARGGKLKANSRRHTRGGGISVLAYWKQDEYVKRYNKENLRWEIGGAGIYEWLSATDETFSNGDAKLARMVSDIFKECFKDEGTLAKVLEEKIPKLSKVLLETKHDPAGRLPDCSSNQGTIDV